MAHKNEGEGWVRAEGTGRYSFQATERVVIADARLDPRSPLLRVQYLTAAQAQAAFRCSSGSLPPNPAGTVRGLVAGLREGEYAFISHGAWQVTASAGAPNFTLLPLTGTDLLAVRLSPDSGYGAMIARRASTLADGAHITLDFGSAEAFSAAGAVLRWQGSRSHLQVNFRTVTGNDLVIQSDLVGSPGLPGTQQSATLRGLPSSRLRDGDVHHAVLASTFAATDQRMLRFRFHELRDLAVQYGPAASQPTFRRLASSPYVRLRAAIPAVPDYDAEVALVLWQDREPGTAQANRLVVTLMATREYFGGTPGTWSLEMPELRQLAGFGSFDSLHDADFQWNLAMYNTAATRPDSLLEEGTLARTASTSGTGR